MKQRLVGRYDLVREIGSGGMGTVYQALDLETGQSVAAKVLIAGEEVQLESIMRFYQEGAVLATLKHPNIVNVHGTHLDSDTCCIIMELLEGLSLAERLDVERFSLARIKHIAGQVAEALTYAHQRGIIHRDIKPGNVMVMGDDRLKVTDFGIARVIGQGATLNTATGTTLGTPLYMAPEQIEGMKVDGRADIYSMGAMLYQMVTGRAPFEGLDPLSVAFQHVHQAPIPPRRVRTNVPEDWEALILKALAKAPVDRFQSASALVNAITALSTPDLPPAGMDDRAPYHPAPASEPEPSVAEPAESIPIAPSSQASAIAEPTTLRPRRMMLGAGAAAALLAAIIVALVIRANTGSGKPVFTAVAIVPAHFRGPQGMGSDSNDSIYVTDRGRHRIVVLSAGGNLLASWRIRNLTGHALDITDVAVDQIGFMYVGAYGSGPRGNNRVRVLSRRGVLRRPFDAPPAPGSGTPDQLTSVAVDQAGNVYATDLPHDRIVKFSPAGRLRATWALPGIPSGQTAQAEGIAVDQGGNIYIAEVRLNRVQKLSPAGQPLIVWAMPGTATGQYSCPTDLAVDSHENVYVANAGPDCRGRGSVQEFSSTGEPLATFGSKGRGPGQLRKPVGIALDSHGDVYVSDLLNNRIVKFAPSGRPLRF